MTSNCEFYTQDKKPQFLWIGLWRHALTLSEMPSYQANKF